MKTLFLMTRVIWNNRYLIPRLGIIISIIGIIVFVSRMMVTVINFPFLSIDDIFNILNN